MGKYVAAAMLLVSVVIQLRGGGFWFHAVTGTYVAAAAGVILSRRGYV